MRTNYPFSIEDLRSITSKYDDYEDILLEYKPHHYSIGLGVTSLCNLKCRFCYYKDPINNTSTSLDFYTIKKIISSLNNLSNISFSLEGEFFCYKDFLPVLDLASLNCDSIDITTNANKLSSNIIDSLKNYPLRSVIVSIDAADQEMYEYLRVGSKFDKVISNIRALTQTLGNEIVKLYCVVSDYNTSSLLELPKLAASLGIKYIGIGQLRENEWTLKNSINRCKQPELLNFLNSFYDELSKYNLTLMIEPFFANSQVMHKFVEHSHLDLVDTSPANNLCPIPWNFTSILSDGRLFACCGDISPIKIEDYSFDGIINHEILRLLRWLIAKQRLPLACLKCHNLL